MREYWIKMLSYLVLPRFTFFLSTKLYQLIWSWLGRKLGIDTQIASKDYNVGIGVGRGVGWLLGLFLWLSWSKSTSWFFFYVGLVLVPAAVSALGSTLAQVYSAWEVCKYEQSISRGGTRESRSTGKDRIGRTNSFTVLKVFRGRLPGSIWDDKRRE